MDSFLIRIVLLAEYSYTPSVTICHRKQACDAAVLEQRQSLVFFTTCNEILRVPTASKKEIGSTHDSRR